MPTTPTTSSDAPPVTDDRGRGVAILVYGLFLGSIMAVVTAPLGVLIAHWKRGRAAAWVDTHLRFQVRTFWLGALGGGLGLAIWNLLGYLALPAWVPWTFGYLFFTACLIWTVGRCGVGIHRLTSQRPIEDPSSLWFGGAAVSLDD